MEKGVKLVDFVNVDSMIQVHDYKGASMFGRTANAKAATKDIIKIMQDNYPEFLVKSLYLSTCQNTHHLSHRLQNTLSMCHGGEGMCSVLHCVMFTHIYHVSIAKSLSLYAHCYLKPLLRSLSYVQSKFIFLGIKANCRNIQTLNSSDELIDTLSEKIPKDNLPAVYTASSSESQHATTTPKEEPKVQENQPKETDVSAADKKEEAELSTSAKNEAAEEENTPPKAVDDDEPKKDEEPISKKAEKQPAVASESNNA